MTASIDEVIVLTSFVEKREKKEGKEGAAFRVEQVA